MLGNLKEDAPDPDDLDGWEDLTDEDKARITAAYASGAGLSSTLRGSRASALIQNSALTVAVAPEDIPETARKPEGEGDDDDDEKVRDMKRRRGRGCRLTGL